MVVAFASGKTVAPEGEFHASFRLSEDGETLVLTGEGWRDRVTIPALGTDRSWGLAQTVT